MDKLPLLRVAEVAFLASNVKECIDFYRKTQWDDFHNVSHSTSIYFRDPAGNIIELWAPRH